MRSNSFYFTNNDHNDSQTRIYLAICSYCFLQDTLKKTFTQNLNQKKNGVGNCALGIIGTISS